MPSPMPTSRETAPPSRRNASPPANERWATKLMQPRGAAQPAREALLPLLRGMQRPAFVALILTTANAASADHCHLPAPSDDRQERNGLGLRVWTSLEAATYDNPPYVGDYQGAALGVSF